MKKTVKNKDGTESVIEGTPEEIAAYEKAQNLNPGDIKESGKKPPVLRGRAFVNYDVTNDIWRDFFGGPGKWWIS